MASIKQFRLPDAGEGLTEAEIVSWKVRPGDTVRVNDVLVEIETAKAMVELPSPFAGVVSELLVGEGETVDVGTPIIAVDTEGQVGESPAQDPSEPGSIESGAIESGAIEPRAAEPGAIEPGLIGGPAPGGRTSVLVGYGPRTAAAARRARIQPGQPEAPVAAPASLAGPAPGRAIPPIRATGAHTAALAAVHVLAKPPVRKLARDLGIELAGIEPTGPGGVVTREDVERAAGAPAESIENLPAAAPAPAAQPAPVGREIRIPVRGVRKLTAQAMVTSAFTAPHVTEWLTVDVTRTMRLVRRLRDDPEFAGVKVSPLLLVARALLIAVRRNPGINATWDEPAGEIVIFRDVNLGIAAATPRGLVVPNIKDAGSLSLRGLADAMARLTAAARDGRTPPADLAGGTITITNVGVFGVDAGTPILNPGEAAILAFGQVRRLPWVHKGKVVPRWLTQLAVSFDHRLVDGDLGSRFLADLGAVLEDPARALAWTR